MRRVLTPDQASVMQAAVKPRSLGPLTGFQRARTTRERQRTFSPGHAMTDPPVNQLLSDAAVGPKALRASCDTCMPTCPASVKRLLISSGHVARRDCR